MSDFHKQTEMSQNRLVNSDGETESDSKPNPNRHKLISLPKAPSFAYVYGCSPRKEGNSDFAQFLIEDELRKLGLDFDRTFLRENKFDPCRGCRTCGDLNKLCVFSGKDGAEKLFEPLLGSQKIFFVSPIYFYHVPALFKGFIDRCQAYWIERANGSPVLENLPRRKAYPVLIAAKKKGDNLFQGTLLTMRLFLDPFNIELAEPLLLRNLDNPTDLALNKSAREKTIKYVNETCRDK